MTENLIVDKTDRITTITINRENRRNALDEATLGSLRGELERAARDGTAIIILTGAGLKAFSAGADIKEMSSKTYEQKVYCTELGQEVADRIENHPALAIAAIEGYCLGGGLEMALACDLRIAGDAASLGLPELKLNALPSWGGMSRLPRIVGSGRARDIVLFSRVLTAAQAAEWGLVSEVVPVGQALAKARAIAEEMAERCDRSVMAIAKGVLVNGLSAPVRAARHMEYLADMSVLASGGLDKRMTDFVSRGKGR